MKNGSTNPNNKVTIVGEIISDFKQSHTTYGENFYEFLVSVKRLSGTVDVIPCIISERSFNVSKEMIGTFVSINGEYRSCNKNVNDKNILVLTVFVNNIEITDEETANPINKNNNNIIILEGYICKEPVYRTTPLGREITDATIAVNRLFNKSDYIPCIFWCRNAKYISRFSVGDKVTIVGRIQSRKYTKKVDEGKTITKITYEVSVHLINPEYIEESNKN